MKKWMQHLFEDAVRKNHENIRRLAASVPAGQFLDLGCDDGAWTSQVATACRAKSIHGVEIVPERAEIAKKNGVHVESVDLMSRLPYADGSFDLVHANQVIEHVASVDQFLAEISRVTKSGGHALVSTENGSSWHNIVAAVFGWQNFSSTNLSYRSQGIGNPLALHRGGKDYPPSMTHKFIFHYRGLKEFFEAYGFRVVDLQGAGYYPLPAQLGRWDPRHAHFITVLAQKL